MSRKQVLYTGFCLAFLLWGLNYVALTFYLYWSLWWYDSMMHFLGGLTLGVLAVWFWNVEKHSLRAFLLIFITVMLLGGVWEVFEYVFDIAGTARGTLNYWKDTIHDMVMDGLGAVLAYFWAIWRTRSLS